MKYRPDSVSGVRLRQYGVSSSALNKTTIVVFRYLFGKAITLPLPFGRCAIIVRKSILDRELDGELADSAALAILVHQYCHAYQCIEWGFLMYVWRHLHSRVRARGVPRQEHQVERECYRSEQAVLDAHTLS